MKIAHIVPFANRSVVDSQAYKMFLTHLVLKDSTYAKWAAQSSGFKILDNSLIELGDALSLQDVLKAAEMIGAKEIILPDVFQKGPETIAAVKEALQELTPEQKDKYSLMAVAQGRYAKEWVECFNELESIPEISTIGIPKVLAKTHPAGRPAFEGFWRYSPKKIHLLGLWYSFTELNEYVFPDKIRSCDTCQAAFLAKYGLTAESVRPDGHTIDLEDTNISTSDIREILIQVRTMLS